MFHPDHYDRAPGGGELLAELGIRPDVVRELVEDERAIRCPDRDSLLPDRPVAVLDTRTPFEVALHEAALLDLLGPCPARPPVE